MTTQTSRDLAYERSYAYELPLCRTLKITERGLKALSLIDAPGCRDGDPVRGRWQGWSCKEAWPVSKFAWCQSCKS